MLPRCRHQACLAAAGLWLALPALSQDDAPTRDDDAAEEDTQSCLSMNLVQSSRAIDDRTILFYLRDGRTYISNLDQNCPGLSRNNRFSYNLRTGARIPRLCRTDSITVIEQTGSGFTCRLGSFQVASEGRVQELLRAASEEPPEVAVTEIEVEVEVEESSSSSSADNESE